MEDSLYISDIYIILHNSSKLQLRSSSRITFWLRVAALARLRSAAVGVALIQSLLLEENRGVRLSSDPVRYTFTP